MHAHMPTLTTYAQKHSHCHNQSHRNTDTQPHRQAKREHNFITTGQSNRPFSKARKTGHMRYGHDFKSPRSPCAVHSATVKKTILLPCRLHSLPVSVCFFYVVLSSLPKQSTLLPIFARQRVSDTQYRKITHTQSTF